MIVLLLSAYGLESWRFTPASIITFRIILGLALAGLVGYLLVRPLMRQATDEQVALYLEEHEPSLQAAIISAVEAEPRPGASSPFSASLVRRLVQSAVEKCRAIEAAASVERRPVRRYGATLGGDCARGDRAVRCSAPPICGMRCRRCSIVSRDVEAAAPYRIEVTPGNATVAAGADQTITAQLSGFDAEQASLMVRKTPDARVRARAAARKATTASTKGCCSISPVRSSTSSRRTACGPSTYTLKVVELPYVQQLELEYHFPAYTGLAAAEGRRRRRHRRAQGHRGARARGPDDGGAGRPDRVSDDKDGRRWRRAAERDHRRR